MYNTPWYKITLGQHHQISSWIETNLNEDNFSFEIVAGGAFRYIFRSEELLVLFLLGNSQLPVIDYKYPINPLLD